MNLYVLNSAFQKTQILDSFTSLIWTERYTSAGDFAFVAAYDDSINTALAEGTFVTVDGTTEVAIVDTVEVKDGDITVKGEMITAFLRNRVLYKHGISNLGAPSFIANRMVIESCIQPNPVWSARIIPNLSTDNPPEMAMIVCDIYTGDVYSLVKNLADQFDMGFVMYVVPGTSNLRFKTYLGTDRTSTQNVVPPVVFGVKQEDLTDTNELRSIASFKNVAYMIDKTDGLYAYYVDDQGRTDENITYSGWNFREKIYMAQDLDAHNGGGPWTILMQRGAKAIKDDHAVSAFDGKVSPTAHSLFGVNYFMGDIVELRSSSGLKSKRRVTEYIRTHDAQGERAYPTLTAID